MRSTLATVSLCGILAGAAPVLAGVLHVSGQPGCWGDTPCYASIQAAVDAALPGDSVRVQHGVYDERVSVVGKSGLVIEGDLRWAPGSAVIEPTGPASLADCLLGAAAVEVASSPGLTLRRLSVHGYAGTGVRLRGLAQGSTGVTLSGLRIVGTGQQGCGAAVRVENGNPATVLAHNLIHGNHHDAVVLEGAPAAGTAVPQYLWANTVFGNSRHGVLATGFDRPLLWNNLIADNGGGSSQDPGAGVVRTGVGALAPLAGADLGLWHNLLCANAAGEVQPAPLEAPQAAGNLTPTGSEGAGYAATPGCGDPDVLFVEAEGLDATWGTLDDDFFPEELAPTVDSGTALPSWAPLATALLRADFYEPGPVRPARGFGSFLYDIGALEWGDPIKPKYRQDQRQRRQVEP